jgi:hypothetical protein
MEDNKDTGLLNKDELIKSLQEFDFTQDEIDGFIQKAEADGKFGSGKEEKEEDDKTIDENKAEEAEDKDDMKKAYDKIMSMKSEMDKSMTEFLDKFGKVPGIPTPTDFTKKSEKEDIHKAEGIDIEKAFGDKFDTISKSIEDRFDSQTKVNEEIVKSLKTMTETVNAIAESPNPFKGIRNSYNFIEKGEKMDENGKQIVSLRSKEQVEKLIEKAISQTENELDKKEMRDTLSDYSIAGKIRPAGFDIVKKALNIDFEK